MGATELDEQVGPLSTLRPNIERQFELKDPSSYIRASVNISVKPSCLILSRTNLFLFSYASSVHGLLSSRDINGLGIRFSSRLRHGIGAWLRHHLGHEELKYTHHCVLVSGLVKGGGLYVDVYWPWRAFVGNHSCSSD